MKRERALQRKSNPWFSLPFIFAWPKCLLKVRERHNHSILTPSSCDLLRSSHHRPPAPPAILKGSLSNASQNSKTYLVYSGTWSYGLDSSSSWKFKLSCEIDSEFDFVSVKEEYVMKGYFIMKDESTEAGKSKVPEEVRTNVPARSEATRLIILRRSDRRNLTHRF